MKTENCEMTPSSKDRPWLKTETQDFLARLNSIRDSWSETECKFRSRVGRMRRRQLLGLINPVAKLEAS